MLDWAERGSDPRPSSRASPCPPFSAPGQALNQGWTACLPVQTISLPGKQSWNWEFFCVDKCEQIPWDALTHTYWRAPWRKQVLSLGIWNNSNNSSSNHLSRTGRTIMRLIDDWVANNESISAAISLGKNYRTMSNYLVGCEYFQWGTTICHQPWNESYLSLRQNSGWLTDSGVTAFSE